MNPTAAIVIAFILGLAFGIAIMALALEQRSKRLRNKFGPEYERLISETGDRRTAETVLERRERRVHRLHLQPLTSIDRAHFQERWRQVQVQFVDDPSRALAQADRLTGEVMTAEGYPMREFEERVADISVDHPVVVENYREAHDVALRNGEGRACTEDLRRAMIHYRKLFDELVDEPHLATAGRTGI
jgi:hypothetical protein